MRPRQVRSQIYLPVTRFGVLDSDWKFVFLTTFLSYVGTFFLDLEIFRVRLEFWASLLGLGVSVAFFNYVRVGRKAHWLEHQIRGRLRPSRLRRQLPADPRSKPWSLGAD